MVIDRETGDLSRWPSIPASAIAEKYTALKAAGDRFPPDVRQMLEDAGWFPGRDIAAAVDQWEVEFATSSRHDVLPTARAAMREFGALSIPQAGPPEAATAAISSRPAAASARTGPKASSRSTSTRSSRSATTRTARPSWSWTSKAGSSSCTGPDDFYLGPNIDAALVSLIRGGDWPDVFSRPGNERRVSRRVPA